MIDYFGAYSRPRVIVYDRGSCFTSNDFDEFLRSKEVMHVKIATGSPQANEQVERVNRKKFAENDYVMVKNFDSQTGVSGN